LEKLVDARLALLAAATVLVVAVSGCTATTPRKTDPVAPTAQSATPTALGSASAAPVVVASAPAKPARGSDYSAYAQLDRNKGLVPPLMGTAEATQAARATCDNSPAEIRALAKSVGAAHPGAAGRVPLQKAITDRSSLISAYCVPKELVAWVEAVQFVDITLSPYAG
jgi:hypothetical protein